jgi:hypothetical protein
MRVNEFAWVDRGTPVFNNFRGFVFANVANEGIRSDPDAKRV